MSPPARAQDRAGIQVHRVRALPGCEVTSVQAIPCTTVARTLVDVAEVLPRRDLERAVDQAEISGLFDLGSLERTLRDHPTRRGTVVLRALLDEYEVGENLTRSELEHRFLEICERFGLPLPRVNVPLRLPHGGTAVVDALWRRDGLVVETDGRASHATSAAIERDRRRDAQLQLAGFRVVRFTWRQVASDPAGVAAILGGLLEPGQVARTGRKPPVRGRGATAGRGAVRRLTGATGAEREGFEPPGPCGPAAFKAAAINRTLPPLRWRNERSRPARRNPPK